MSAGRVILHSDLNCFYASVEMMLNPALRDKAVAVCGSTEDRHGNVLAKSKKAKKPIDKTFSVWYSKQAVRQGTQATGPAAPRSLKKNEKSS